MQYLLLIHHSDAEWARLNAAEQGAIYQEYREVIQQLTEAGKYLGGNQLKPAETATTVRVRDKRRVTTDGPFAETKEQLAGYFLVNAKDINEAIAMAERIPSARNGSIEVRELMPKEQPPR